MRPRQQHLHPAQRPGRPGPRLAAAGTQQVDQLADGAAVIQWTCSGGTNQMFTLKPATALGNGKDHQLVAVHSGKCVDVSGVSTAPGALVHQWTCDLASALAPKKNQIWRLPGKA
ncbi:RICIN domain-containing protein [Kitasatospora sp. NPDC085879]|uniref:RICIN domain-containing protein n=1 Tax=Kitasatospora sp. NPDC085879 TaxID=3154769 RepID=UPI00343494D5